MKKVYLLAIFIATIFTACGPNNPGISPWAKEQKVYGFSFIEGKVVEVFADKAIVQLDDKDVVQGDAYEDKLTNKIIKQSMFIKGMNTSIGKQKAIVEDVRGEQITFTVDTAKIDKDDAVKIYIPKKTIAIMDFSLIGMENSGINKFAMEDMTTRMVQSGQYIVVERVKLNAILKEQELADSGLLNQSASSKIGKLLSADIILTGSFAKQQDKWNVNLRLVDVATGVILSAINEKISGDQFRVKQSKDSSNITEDFEDNQLASGWMKNLINKRGSKSKSTIDNTTGANGTKGSFKISYKFKNGKSATVFFNKRLRDISKYKGIKFYAKSQKDTTLAVIVHDQNYDNAKVNRWKSLVTVENNWKEYKIPFSYMTIAKNHARNNPGGDGSFDKDNVESIAFAIGGKANKKQKRISIWLDEITFY